MRTVATLAAFILCACAATIEDVEHSELSHVTNADLPAPIYADCIQEALNGLRFRLGTRYPPQRSGDDGVIELLLTYSRNVIYLIEIVPSGTGALGTAYVNDTALDLLGRSPRSVLADIAAIMTTCGTPQTTIE